jgi:hypothetical protein
MLDLQSGPFAVGVGKFRIAEVPDKPAMSMTASPWDRNFVDNQKSC